MQGVRTGARRKIEETRVENPLNEPARGTVAVNECDTNADTCCLGSNFIVLKITNRTVDVYPYDSSYKPIQNVPIVTGATAVDDEQGNTTILVINEALYYGSKLDHSLINPNQIRHFGIHVQDNPYDQAHPIGITYNEEGGFIPFRTKGTKVQFTSRVPTDHELHTCNQVELTSDSQWNPESVMMQSVTRKRKGSYADDTRPYKRQLCSTNMLASETQYSFLDPSTDEAILSQVNSVLVEAKERFISKLSQEINQDDIPTRHTFISDERHGKRNASEIAERWLIGLNKAKATLMATTQRSSRSAILPLSRRYRADRMYNLKRLDAKFATDTLYGDVRSLLQNSCAQIYSHKIGFHVCYPMSNAKGVTIGYTLRDFCHDFGVPANLTFDGALAQVGRNTEFMKAIRKYHIEYHVSGPRRPNENPAEGAIREVKKRWYRIMLKKNVHPRLWDFGLVWVCETGNLTVSSSRYAQGRTPIEYITGDTPDISEYLDFGFYDWVTYRTDAGLGPLSLGRWLGVSHKVGQLMSYWILTRKGRVISCTTVQRVTNAELSTIDWQNRTTEFDQEIKEKLNVKDPSAPQPVNDTITNWNSLSLDNEDQEFLDEWNRVINDDDLPEADENELEGNGDIYDPYINMEVGLPRGDDDQLIAAKVKGRALDEDGEMIGQSNNNPLLDTRLYEVEYIDGTTERLTANIIAENVLAQVDEDGHRQMLLDEIIDHRKLSSAIPKEKGHYIVGDTKRKKMTTQGWEICVQWKDGSTDWIKLKDLKDTYPVELAEYSINAGISDEPAFAWWVPYTIKKRVSIIAKVKSKYWQRTHKYGIRVPKSVEEALRIDEENGNHLWREAIEEEMKKIKEAFKKYNGDPRSLIGYTEITTHIIFDIKLGENFRRKARLVADGNKTETPSSVTYSTVVSRDSVRICLMLAALNGLEVMAADVENAYLTAPCREKCWTRGGIEFGNDKGQVFIIDRALYGLKSSGAAFRAFLAERLDDMGFKSSGADPDVWLRQTVKIDGERCYEYILVYVDDLLCISVDATSTLNEVQHKFKFKKGKIAPPEIYLGGRLEKKKLNDKDVWTITSQDYVKAAVANVEEMLKKKKKKLYSKAVTPMSATFVPELDTSEELNPEGVTSYQEMIGVLRWAIELGRVDILHEVSILSQYQASPREGHMEEVLHIFAYLKKKPKLTLYFNPDDPVIDENIFSEHSKEDDFKELYRDAEEQMPDRMPTPLGPPVNITAFVDASHASNKVTRRSHTGFVLFVQRAPVIWYSKRQSTVESSTFSSEFIAMKVCMEHIVALRFKLRMLGVNMNGPAKILSDNKSMVNNSSKVESCLNKKHSSIAYHAVRWAAAAGVIKTAWIDTNTNIADAFTKRLTVMKRDTLFGDWTY